MGDRSSRFSHSEERHDQIDGAFEADPDDDIRLHSTDTEVMRQLVGPYIQLAIGHAVCVMHHCDNIRRLLGLVFEASLDTPSFRLMHRMTIEFLSARAHVQRPS